MERTMDEMERSKRPQSPSPEAWVKKQFFKALLNNILGWEPYRSRGNMIRRASTATEKVYFQRSSMMTWFNQRNPQHANSAKLNQPG